MKKCREGRSLEMLVSHLEKALGVDGVAKVESPKLLPDRITGRMREHDVVVTLRHAHHEAIIAIECRDRSRPVGTPQVEAFHTKCEDTGVHQGVIVSSKGFYRPAIRKAEHLGIRCLDIEEATSHEWLLAPGLRLRQRRLVHLTSRVRCAKLHDDGDYIFVTEKGDEVSPEALNQAILNEAEIIPWDSRPGREQRSEFELEVKGLYLLNRKTGSQSPIDGVQCKLSFEVVEKLIPFKLVKYGHSESGECIAEAAIAEVNSRRAAGKVVIVYKPDEGGQVVFVREQSDLRTRD